MLFIHGTIPSDSVTVDSKSWQVGTQAVGSSPKTAVYNLHGFVRLT